MERDIVERTYKFALRTVKFVRALPKEFTSIELGRQLLRAGTSVAANVEEAQGAFSKGDFIFKMQTAFKEARESNLWLRLIKDSGLVSSKELDSLIQESSELKNILAQIVKSSKGK